MRAGAALAALAIAGLAGCGKSAAPNAPQAQLPPQVAQVFPPARSAHVLYDTAIWAEFQTPLDPVSVNDHTVFLKVDTVRLPITVSWNALTKRIVITPQGLLSLLRTHTIEFSPNLKTADGTPLGRTYYWQFTTVGIRRPRAPLPADRASGESPFVTLEWVGTESSAGAINYDVYVDADSAAVAAHTVPSLGNVPREFFTPPARWGQDRPVYWTLITHNTTSNETLEGPVWRFDPLPVSTPIDTVFTPASDWGMRITVAGFFGPTTVSRCNNDTLVSGGGDNYVRFSFAGLGPSMRLAGAALDLDLFPGYTADASYAPSMGGVGNAWTLCVATGALVVPQSSGTIANGEVVPLNRFRFSSDALSLHIEAQVRRGGNHAYTFTSGRRVAYYFFPIPRIKLYVYHPATPTAATHSAP